MIRADHVSRVYSLGKTTVHALRDVSFTISPGEFVGITGASGSGKSTLLHIIGLLDQPTSGTLTINDTSINELSEDEKTEFRLQNLGYVFQDYALVPELSVLENVFLPAKARGMPKDEYLRKSEEILSQVGLGHRMYHKQNELSGGEQQRVAIARALINTPKILFADEPCANLDSKTSRNILDLFKRLNEEYSQTIIMVTHEEWHEEYMCRMIILSDGEISDQRECHRKSNPP
ncbi:MAG TPA: ABC transporter ATP-binding protein [Methanospirillum sp.]|uniref:ABC transporter ATP-binding protein n=1 Tax=Methanospirillum sp. TaxID=45200 RepID=UPI002BC82D5F|nr:ABC transporter ATP-binding protein [Methanospirillum sp.]HWQ63482.1 ABC transporter ATP-binding protein [Methanospirillum sp.]